ncbi:IS66 family transposase [Roseomonas sp. M0104]|uniref:IS66 family transposase n=1 Tax=Teichococcus coralli TaxID=2545983 RepID=A0A845BGC9_9PROT|nr:IS66 family transposase [Pseudoroseomonas coralli]MXP65958.1 IS66 family transposase [Pseudoroseomonas coralli]
MGAADTMPSLPEDPAALRALLLATLEQRDAALAERDALATRNEQLHHLLLKLKRRQFGQKSERLPEDQLLFAFEEIEATLAASEAEAGQRSKALREQQAKRRRGNGDPLPPHLPRIEQVLMPERETCPCCDGLLVEIGADSAERLDVLPARFRVLVTRRPKLACRACPGVVLQAPATERLVPGGLPTEATVAQVLVARYADHLPLYRQAQMLARQGLTLGREVLADWLGTAALEIRPVVRRLREILLASPRLFADETTLPVLDPGRGKVKKGYAWALARDDRPWGGTDPPAVVFHYAPGRGQEHARALLADYRGIVQCDGYAAYKALTGDVTLAFCWSHVRRGFFDLARSGAAPIATEVLQRIAALYAIEAEIRGRPAPERLAMRQARSRSLVAELFTWLDAQLGRLPRSSPTAEAIRYALNHRKGLEQFLDDGCIETDTNIVERAIRPICLSRKNALFASGDNGGARWAAIASLVETCKLNGVDPQRYFTDLLTRLVNGWPNSRIDELMPWCWAKPGDQPSSAAA